VRQVTLTPDPGKHRCLKCGELHEYIGEDVEEAMEFARSV
jgi:hypothetical protein